MNSLYMVEMILDLPSLYRFVSYEGFSRFNVEDDPGYSIHVWLKKAFGEKAPSPFRIFLTRNKPPRILGYSPVDGQFLRNQLVEYAEPSVVSVCPPERIQSKKMPLQWEEGRRLGFEVLVSPIVRRGSREKDAFLAAADKTGKSAGLRREDVYREWFFRQIVGAAECNSFRVKGFNLAVHVRLTQRVDGKRVSRRLIFPQAIFSGRLTVVNSDGFSKLLKRGLGRHRAFGYGMLLLRP